MIPICSGKSLLDIHGAILRYDRAADLHEYMAPVD